jgi:hypothetical protein
VVLVEDIFAFVEMGVCTVRGADEERRSDAAVPEFQPARARVARVAAMQKEKAAPESGPRLEHREMPLSLIDCR